MTVEAVLFDFGGVFIDSPFAAVDIAATKLGIDPVLLLGVVFGSYDEDTDHPWHRLERGEVTFGDARRAITDLAVAAGLGELDPFTVLAELAGQGLVVRDFMLDAVHRYRRAGLKTGIVTNNVAEFGDSWRGLMPLDELFDDVVDSSSVHVRKPDARIYALACERLDIAPGAAVFIDDHEGNAAGARRAGLLAVCCGYSADSAAAALTQLDRIALPRD